MNGKRNNITGLSSKNKIRLRTYLSFSAWTALFIAVSFVFYREMFILEKQHEENILNNIAPKIVEAIEEYSEQTIIDFYSFKEGDATPSPFQGKDFSDENGMLPFYKEKAKDFGENCKVFIGEKEDYFFIVLESKFKLDRRFYFEYFDRTNKKIRIEYETSRTKPDSKDRKNGLTRKGSVRNINIDGEIIFKKSSNLLGESTRINYMGMVERNNIDVINIRIKKTSELRKQPPNLISNNISFSWERDFFENICGGSRNLNSKQVKIFIKGMINDLSKEENIRTGVNHIKYAKSIKFNFIENGYENNNDHIESKPHLVSVLFSNKKYNLYLAREIEKIQKEFIMRNYMIFSLVPLILILVIFNAISINKIMNRFSRITYKIQSLSKEILSQDEIKNEFLSKESLEADEIGELANSFNRLLHIINDERVRLKNEHQIKSNINDMVGHEVVSPLSSLQRMLENNEKPLQEVNRALRMITTIRAARREESNFTADPDMLEDIDLRYDIESYINNISYFDNLKFQSSYEPCVCKVDIDLLVQAIEKLIGNADEHRIEKTPIIIDLRKRDYKVVLSVYNDGKNIPEDDMVKIFSYGFSTKKGENCGIGLSIVHTIISSMGGVVKAKNTQSGVMLIIEIPCIS